MNPKKVAVWAALLTGAFAAGRLLQEPAAKAGESRAWQEPAGGEFCAGLEGLLQAAGKRMGVNKVGQLVVTPSSGDPAWCYQVQVDAAK